MQHALDLSEMLDEGQVVRMSKEYRKTCGVYFLVNGNRVVYVGQSVDVASRLSQHANNGIEFDRYYVLLCDKDDLNALEAAYIAFMPCVDNKSRPNSKTAINFWMRRVEEYQKEIDGLSLGERMKRAFEK